MLSQFYSFLFLGALVQAVAAANPSNFSLRSATDNKVFNLSDARGKFVALHFLLKTECPVCLKHTGEYARHAAANPDVVHVFIKPDTDEEIKTWAQKLAGFEPPITIFRDPEARIASSFGIPGGYKFHGEEVHYPALVILNAAGQEVFRYIGKSNADRYSIADFTSKLAELKGGNDDAIKHYNLGPGRLAISGYDLVAYFTKNTAIKGDSRLSSKYRDVVYHFSSIENKQAFAANPEKYLPTFGGWCATAMAKGEKVEIDPTNFKVTNGRLFLFFKAFYANALKDWNKDEPALTAKADAQWKRISGE